VERGERERVADDVDDTECPSAKDSSRSSSAKACVLLRTAAPVSAVAAEARQGALGFAGSVTGGPVTPHQCVKEAVLSQQCAESETSDMSTSPTSHGAGGW
jgi:hypothetical protein